MIKLRQHYLPGPGRFRDTMDLLLLSMRLQGGRRFWLIPLLPLAWLLLQGLFQVLGWLETDFSPVDAQNALIGLPLTVLGIGLGIQIIAGEIEDRTLEVCYTVPGGASRIWFSKLAAMVLLLTTAGALLAAGTSLFLTDYPLTALYGAWQGAVFYMVLGMSLGALTGNRMSAGLFAGALLILNAFVTGVGTNPTRYSPLFNPLALAETPMDAAQIMAWTIQNRIGTALAVCALLALTLARAERRELLLSEGG